MYAVSPHVLNSSSSSAQSASSMDSSYSQAQRDKIKQLIKDNYEIYISNVDHLDEAEVVCFGDNHGRDEHKRINGQIVDMLYVDESILLIEKTKPRKNGGSSLPIDHDSNKQAKYVTKPIPIQGWDIELDENRLKVLNEFITANMICKQPKVVHFLSLSTLSQWRDDLENNQLSTFSRITTLLSIGCITSCLSLFILSCTPCIKKYYQIKALRSTQKIIDEIPIRNQSMCETIQDISGAYKKIFVMGGNLHLYYADKEVRGIDQGPYIEGVNKTIDFLSGKKFAILIPKTQD